tara:strand:+ start:828 stop:1268 length:441 start_codon:yes stop_codon:yes gene_type:complete
MKITKRQLKKIIREAIILEQAGSGLMFAIPDYSQLADTGIDPEFPDAGEFPQNEFENLIKWELVPVSSADEAVKMAVDLYDVKPDRRLPSGHYNPKSGILYPQLGKIMNGFGLSLLSVARESDLTEALYNAAPQDYIYRSWSEVSK